MSIIIGIIGSLCVLIAWAFDALESAREHKSLVDLRFSFLYLAGVVTLTIYSFIINNIIFMSLELAITVLVVAEIIYSLIKFKKMKL